jgi:carbamoyl-phosphate synthase small subunit
MNNVKLVLENGMIFEGKSFGKQREKVCEIVFNTSMVGYQEIISDQSYNEQFVVMTYPLIGNYGLTDDDYESISPSIGGFIVKEINNNPSNFRYTKTVSDVLEENGIPGVYDVDTRKLTRIIRDYGSMVSIITDIDTPLELCIKKIKDYRFPTSQIESTTCKKKWHAKTHNHKYNVVAIDCGIKLNIIRKLNEKGCNVLVIPYGTSSQEIMSYNPDGIFLSNGPGNPENATSVIQNVIDLQDKYPIFGICLGHQIIALANKARTYKLKFGHRGGNHPVINLANSKVEITSQNHSYAVDPESLVKSNLIVTHKNILDNTIEGLRLKDKPVFSVQYHPESAPGPHDSDYLFDIFIENIKKNRGDINA